MNTGENEQGLKKIIDLIRMIGISVLLIHFYYNCYGAFRQWGLVSALSDRILTNLTHTGLLKGFLKSKLIALGFLLLSLLGVKGRKDEKLQYATAFIYLVAGMLLYFLSGFILLATSLSPGTVAAAYIGTTLTGFIMVLTGGGLLTRIIKKKLSAEVFNTANESFPQEERLITNDYSINLPAEYLLKGKLRQSWVSFINPRRSLLILGGPGSGKSFYIIEECIRQLIEKQTALFVFDFKFPDLSLVAYNHFLKYRHTYKIEPSFHYVNFTDVTNSDQCNPLFPEMMTDILDAFEASKTMLLSINKSWAGRQGEFFVESPINFLAAVFWFLKKFQSGIYCTIPHAVELVQLEYDKLFTVLNSELEIQSLVSPFTSAYLSDVMETVESQIASVRIPLARLSSPQLYYLLSGNDFSMDINNPLAPKIVCLGSDPTKSEALSPILSVFCDRMNKIINQKGKYKCATIYDEFAQIRVASVQNVISVGRGHDISVILALQDYSQLKRVYSRDEAESIFNMAGNIISGQVSGETAKLLSERFPKIMQDRESLSINASDTSISRSKHLDVSIQPATISSLSSGEFVGVVADDPTQLIEHKPFHCKIKKDFDKINREKAAYAPLPDRGRKPGQYQIIQTYDGIKQDVRDMAEMIVAELLNDPERQHLVIRK